MSSQHPVEMDYSEALEKLMATVQKDDAQEAEYLLDMVVCQDMSDLPLEDALHDTGDDWTFIKAIQDNGSKKLLELVEKTMSEYV